MRLLPRWLRQPPQERMVFVTIAEAGRLEVQIRRLISSMRTFGGRWANAPIYVFQPRAGPDLARETHAFLEENECHFIAMDLNKSWADWGLFNKPYVCAHLEASLAEKADLLVFLDSDQLMLNEPIGLCLKNDKWLGIKPVDMLNIASPAQEPLDDYWRRIYSVAGVPLDIDARVFPSVEDVPIRPYFNAGVIVSRPRTRLFQSWFVNAERMAEHRTWWEGLSHLHHYHIVQAVFSATVLAQIPMERIELLSIGMNYPLNVQHLLPQNKRLTHLNQITLLHYKESFNNSEWTQRMHVSVAQRKWLLQQNIPV